MKIYVKCKHGNDEYTLKICEMYIKAVRTYDIAYSVITMVDYNTKDVITIRTDYYDSLEIVKVEY